MSGATSHLLESEHVDLLDGTLPASRQAHIDTCADCHRQAKELRAAMGEAHDIDVPEPPPFFWEQLSARVRASVALEPTPSARVWRGWSALTVPRLAALAAVVSIVVAVAVWRASTPASDGRAVATAIADASGSAADPDEDGFGDIETDENWALVRTVADDLSTEAIDAEGLGPRPGSAEALAYRLSDVERIALAQILEDEMKRSKRPEAAS